uniref:inter-alpha-trypsin inhibitor heavy chain H3-like n=1 Tax=Myxine glutinosa TaxID=7769 RepID=UPI00358F1B78
MCSSEMLLSLVTLLALLAPVYQAALVISPLNDASPRSRREAEGHQQDISKDGIDMYSVRIVSTITSRFANTVTTSRLKNKNPDAREVKFELQLPPHAFISNFTMVIDDDLYIGVVKQKKVAKVQYEKAKSQGQSAGLIRTANTSPDNFVIAVNVASQSKVTMEVTYQELLQRQLGRYSHVISLRPHQLVHHFQVDVYIFEQQGLTFVEVEDFHSSHAVNLTRGEQKAHITFKPTLEDQRMCLNCLETKLDNDFTIHYDVNRDLDAGQIQIVNGYFVHFFAPVNLHPLPKNIVFIIDISSSMWGQKIIQTREAMVTILGQLKPEDHFTLVQFSHRISTWNDEMTIANEDNIEKAQQFSRQLTPSGMTNINDAVLRGSAILRKAREEEKLPAQSASILLLLTDGDPTYGEKNKENIRRNVKNDLGEDVVLFCLGFGMHLDYGFLEKMALENQGLARKIFEGADAPLQLKGFYDEVATPLLSKIHLEYPDNIAVNVTRSEFETYFDGSELVVAGRIVNNSLESFSSSVTAKAELGDLTLIADVGINDTEDLLEKQQYIFGAFTERLWAYLTIKQLLTQRMIEPNPEVKQILTDKALNISLKYGFVTPLTSMVITKQQRVKKQAPDVTARKVPPTEGKRKVTGVDSDPHFIIELPGQQQHLCFNIDEEPGRIINLLTDIDNGISVNGQIIGAKKVDDKTGKLQTYIGRLGIVLSDLGIFIDISTESIVVRDSNGRTKFPWNDVYVKKDNFSIQVSDLDKLFIFLPIDTSFEVVLHRVWRKNEIHRSFLGFYTMGESSFSPRTHGLIGQFFKEPAINIFNIRPGQEFDKPIATMQVKGHTLQVTRGHQMDYRTHKHGRRSGDAVTCWFVHHNANGLIDGDHSNYLMPDMYSFLDTRGMA